MKKFISRFIFVLILSAIALGQNEALKLIQVDEFGKINLDEMMARLDNLATQTEKTPNSKALIRVYGNSLEGGKNPYIYDAFNWTTVST